MKPYTWLLGRDGNEADIFQNPVTGLLAVAMSAGELGLEEEERSGNSSPILPQQANTSPKLLITKGSIGRRDWTRTNDPHHVKVVL